MGGVGVGRWGGSLSRLQPNMHICPLFIFGCRKGLLVTVLMNVDPLCLAVALHSCPLSTCR